MSGNHLDWQTPSTREMLMGLALFVLPMLPSLVKFVWGYQPITNQIGSALTIGLIIFTLAMLILGLAKGVSRWSLPYFGVLVSVLVLFDPATGLFSFLAPGVRKIVRYQTKTLLARIGYSAFRQGFFWFLFLIATILLVSLLTIWQRTRVLAQRIRQDWTQVSFLIFSGMVLNLELIFEEYAYDELWKIACRVGLVLGAWIYFKNANQRVRILALLVGTTFSYWIAAIGKWMIVPNQSWSAFYGYDHETYRWFEFWRTLVEWSWVVVFMLVPSVVNLIPGRGKASTTPLDNSMTEDSLTPGVSG